MTPGGNLRSGVLVGALALAISVSPATQGRELNPLSQQLNTLNPGPAKGVHFHCNRGAESDAYRAEIAAKLGAAGVKTVRIDLGWESLQPSRRRFSPWHVQLADRCVNLARAGGMDVLITILWTPSWANGNRGRNVPPARNRDFAWFARWAARHFRGRVSAWEIWNEPGNKEFWRGSQRRYVSLLRAAYPAIKAGDPQAKVVFGGVSHNDDRYVAAAYRLGAKGAFDVMATHPYQGLGDSPPELPDTGKDWWLMTHVDAVHRVMARNGDGAKPIWFTEYGWSVHDNRPGEPNWSRGVTAAEQASYLVRTFAMLKARYPYVQKTYWYKDASRRGEDPHLSGFGLLRTDLSPRPAYFALASVAR
jgi:polysaccharide biosynthesis protein PslG